MISQTDNQVLHFNMSVCRNLNPTTSEGFHCAPGPAGICLGPFPSNTPQYLVIKELYQSLHTLHLLSHLHTVVCV